MREIWNDSEKIGTSEHNQEPKVGDVLEISVKGETQEYTVEKVYDFFPLEGRPQRRLAVSYSGRQLSWLASPTKPRPRRCPDRPSALRRARQGRTP